jgi:hypothetical protein
MINVFKPFTSRSTVANLKAIHRAVYPNFDIDQLGLEYEKLLQMDYIQEMREKSRHDLVNNLATSEYYAIFTISSARF